jgi:hypothetical protein
MTIVINGDSVKIPPISLSGKDQASGIGFPDMKFTFDFLMVII